MESPKNTKKSSVLQQWRKKKKNGSAPTTIPKRNESQKVFVTSGQKRLWMLQQLYPLNPFYQYAHLYKINGPLNFQHLENSIQFLFDKHEILRSNFENTNEGIEVKIKDQIQFQLSIAVIEDDPEKVVEETDQFVNKLFDLSNDVLLRIKLIQTGSEESLMILSIHHIIGDRSSLLSFHTELFEVYQKLNEGQPLSSPANELQYADYAHWKNQQEPDQKNIEYWLEKLSGDLQIIRLPADHVRPRKASFKGATVAQKLSTELTDKISIFSKQYQTTPYVVLLAVLKILLFRYSNQEDILVASPFSNRDLPVLDKVIGFFNETVVLKTSFNDQDSFSTIVKQLKANTLEAMEHKDVPFDTLVKKLQPKRDSSANPIFQTMFVYNQSAGAIEVPDLVIKDKPVDLKVSKFDLTLFANKIGNELEIALEYAQDLFEEATIKRMLFHFENLLNNLLEKPEQNIATIDYLSENEIQQLVQEWNFDESNSPQLEGIHFSIEKIAESAPESIAVQFQTQSLSYKELNDQANSVAQYLIDQGIKIGEPVGLYCERSVEMIVGIFGILKSGAAYVPLDPEYPKNRIEYILKDAGAKFILSHLSDSESTFPSGTTTTAIVDAIKYEEKSSSLPETGFDLAYLIYTSGSTGQAKGVAISHSNLIHSTFARFDYYDHQPSAFLLLSSFSFDSSVAGIFWTLCAGGTLVIPDKKIEQDIQKLSSIIERNKISHTLLLPSLYQLVLDYASLDQLQTLQTVIVAGEACSTALALNHFKKLSRVTLVNEYGPTEGTVWSTAYQIKKEDSFGSVPIGRSTPFMENFVLDKNKQLVPLGVDGELYVAGKGLASGYWNKEELTDQRFLAHPYKKGEKIYRTGDLVKYNKDGQLLFLGRIDQQVKIRGHRIEPDEIKNSLLKVEGIDNALVTVQVNGDFKRLIAYYCTKTNLQAEDLKQFLSLKFPAFMVPTAFIRLSQIPTLPNGKIDFKALPAAGQQDMLNESNYVAPRNEQEQTLVNIWQKVLAIQPIGVFDNFFEIGGDSIQSIKVIAQSQKAGILLAPNQLFEHQSIAEIVHQLNLSKDKENTNEQQWSSMVSINKKGKKPPLFCIHSGGGHVFFYKDLAELLKEDHPLYALQASGLNGKKERQNSIEQMAGMYIDEIKKIQPIGPYHILGTCFSNAVGLEIANQLKERKEEIGLFIIVDSGPKYLMGAKERGGKQTSKRFLKMLKDKNWKAIQRKLRNRFIRLRQKALAPLENEQERNLRMTITNLNKIYSQYNWKPFDGKITFIRSTEFANRKDKQTHIEQWSKLSKEKLEVHIVEGHHQTLFFKPEVDGLAKKINECFDAIY